MPDETDIASTGLDLDHIQQKFGKLWPVAPLVEEIRDLRGEVERLRDGIRRLPCDHRRLDLHGGFCPRCRLLDDRTETT